MILLSTFEHVREDSERSIEVMDYSRLGIQAVGDGIRATGDES